MKKNKKLFGALISFGAATTCLVGGTYAWYVVSNTATASLGGTTIKVTDGLKIAVKGSKTDKDAWEKSQDGYTLSENMIKEATEIHGYSGNSLKPVTSGSFKNNDEIQLKKAPEYNSKDINAAADKNSYMNFTLKFETSTPEQSIYLNESMLSITGSEALRSSVRIGFSTGQDAERKSYIFNPKTKSSTEILTKVGGIMDLNGDGVYDYTIEALKDVVSSESSTDLVYKEVFYGELAADTTSHAYKKYETADGTAAKPVPGSNTIWHEAKHVMNAVSTTPGSEETNFLYNLYLPNQAMMTDIPTQASYGSSYFADHINGTPIAKTSSTPATQDGTDYTVEVSVWVWLEGWDKNCTNAVSEKSFTSTLGFIAPGVTQE